MPKAGEGNPRLSNSGIAVRCLVSTQEEPPGGQPAVKDACGVAREAEPSWSTARGCGHPASRMWGDDGLVIRAWKCSWVIGGRGCTAARASPRAISSR
jgi:hypothetical protein